MLFNNALTFSAVMENYDAKYNILHNLTWNQGCPKAITSGSVPYTVTSNHCVVVCGILLQVTQCDSVVGVGATMSAVPVAVLLCVTPVSLS